MTLENSFDVNLTHPRSFPILYYFSQKINELFNLDHMKRRRLKKLNGLSN